MSERPTPADHRWKAVQIGDRWHVVGYNRLAKRWYTHARYRSERRARRVAARIDRRHEYRTKLSDIRQAHQEADSQRIQDALGGQP